MKKIGKIGKRNIEANKILKEKFEELGICWCENCGRSDVILTLAHRHRREWYRKKENQEKLHNIKEVLCLCLECHQEIEHNFNKTEELFKKLRNDYD